MNCVRGTEMVVDRLIATGRVAPELRGPLRTVLMARHLHLHQRQHGHATASAMLLPMIKSIAAAREAYRVRDRAAGTRTPLARFGPFPPVQSPSSTPSAHPRPQLEHLQVSVGVSRI